MVSASSSSGMRSSRVHLALKVGGGGVVGCALRVVVRHRRPRSLLTAVGCSAAHPEVCGSRPASAADTHAPTDGGGDAGSAWRLVRRGISAGFQTLALGPTSAHRPAFETRRGGSRTWVRTRASLPKSWEQAASLETTSSTHAASRSLHQLAPRRRPPSAPSSCSAFPTCALHQHTGSAHGTDESRAVSLAA